MPDSLHQIDYAPSTGRPSWWNRRTTFIVILAVAAVLSGIIVVPRVVTRAVLLQRQSELARSGAEGRSVTVRELRGAGIDTFSDTPVYAGLRQARDEAELRLVVVGVGQGAMQGQVFERATWMRNTSMLTAIALAPPVPVRKPEAFMLGYDDPENPSRFVIPVVDITDEGPSDTLLGYIVGHLLHDESLRLDWEPLDPEPTTRVAR